MMESVYVMYSGITSLNVMACELQTAKRTLCKHYKCTNFDDMSSAKYADY